MCPTKSPPLPLSLSHSLTHALHTVKDIFLSVDVTVAESPDWLNVFIMSTRPLFVHLCVTKWLFTTPIKLLAWYTSLIMDEVVLSCVSSRNHKNHYITRSLRRNSGILISAWTSNAPGINRRAEYLSIVFDFDSQSPESILEDSFVRHKCQCCKKHFSEFMRETWSSGSDQHCCLCEYKIPVTF